MASALASSASALTSRVLAVFIVFFGELPPWLPLTLHSMASNPRVSFVIIGDCGAQGPPALVRPRAARARRIPSTGARVAPRAARDHTKKSCEKKSCEKKQRTKKQRETKTVLDRDVHAAAAAAAAALTAVTLAAARTAATL